MKKQTNSLQLIRKYKIYLLLKLVSTRAIITSLCVLATPRAIIYCAVVLTHRYQ